MKDESPSDPSSCCVRAINLDAWQFLKLPNLAEPDGIGTLDIAECFRLKEKLWHKARLLSDAHRLARLGHWEYLVDDGRMIWSLEIAELLGFQAEDRMPSPSQRAGMHTAESWRRFDAALERTITTGEPFQLDVEIRRRDGEHCWFMVQGEAERDDAGRVVKVIGIAQDITEHKTIEAALRASERRLEEAQTLCQVGSWELDRDSAQMKWSREVFRLFDRPESLGVPDLNEAMCYYTPESLEQTRSAFWRAIDTGERCTLEQEVRLPSGAIRHHATVIVPVADSSGRTCKLFGTVQDITERRVLELERSKQLGHVAELSRRLVMVQERERRRLASELHERASPNLAALQLTFSNLASALPPDVLAEVEPLLDDIRGLLADTTAGIREISTEMRPATLDHAGLLPALQDYTYLFSQRSGIEVELAIDDFGVPLAPELQSVLFRIVQEALTNCAKHASAGCVRVSLAQDGNALELRIADDGIGFEPSMLTEPGSAVGLGLITMRERAEFVGGRFSLSSHPGKGTEIRISFDLHEDAP
ncbi:PAS domain-containing protein [Thauera sp. 2A1]|uniref:PAS domain-containing sensor histidine kinase n=1 Tax=Thauera sp. 2A1 TaxID=2570191 RepID=UPI001884A89F|nr:PAS domain-containing protein [Thauera sp. 2A1]